jgi:hypothetical protein
MNLQNESLKLLDVLALIEQLSRKSDLHYAVRCLAAAHHLLVTKYAPFHEGDRVELSKTPEINEKRAPGWMGCKHFLIEGAMGIVRHVGVHPAMKDCKQGDIEAHLSYGIEFDDESAMVDGKRIEIKGEDRHLYTFGENYLRLHLT